MSYHVLVMDECRRDTECSLVAGLRAEVARLTAEVARLKYDVSALQELLVAEQDATREARAEVARLTAEIQLARD
jgi:outer membrane murein-binding lipoprotein Lpp